MQVFTDLRSLRKLNNYTGSKLTEKYPKLPKITQNPKKGSVASSSVTANTSFFEIAATNDKYVEQY